jgi:hypothetical protein
LKVWGCSSAGRVPDWQSGGREFDPRQLHQQNKQLTPFLKNHFSRKIVYICILFAFYLLSYFCFMHVC